MCLLLFILFLLFTTYFMYLFLEREREGEREGEKHPLGASTGDLVCNPGTCPARESNQQPFGL